MQLTDPQSTLEHQRQKQLLLLYYSSEERASDPAGGYFLGDRHPVPTQIAVSTSSSSGGNSAATASSNQGSFFSKALSPLKKSWANGRSASSSTVVAVAVAAQESTPAMAHDSEVTVSDTSTGSDDAKHHAMPDADEPEHGDIELLEASEPHALDDTGIEHAPELNVQRPVDVEEIQAIEATRILFDVFMSLDNGLL